MSDLKRDGRGGTREPNMSGSGDLNFSGQTVMIVEDEFLIAVEYASYLESLGATVIGPVTTVAAALSMIETVCVDAAVLDINLNGVKSFDVGDVLMRQKVRFVFATGYDDAIIPDRFQSVTRCEKPATPAEIALALSRAVLA